MTTTIVPEPGHEIGHEIGHELGHELGHEPRLESRNESDLKERTLGSETVLNPPNNIVPQVNDADYWKHFIMKLYFILFLFTLIGTYIVTLFGICIGKGWEFIVLIIVNFLNFAFIIQFCKKVKK